MESKKLLKNKKNYQKRTFLYNIKIFKYVKYRYIKKKQNYKLILIVKNAFLHV